MFSRYKIWNKQMKEKKKAANLKEKTMSKECNNGTSTMHAAAGIMEPPPPIEVQRKSSGEDDSTERRIKFANDDVEGEKEKVE